MYSYLSSLVQVKLSDLLPSAHFALSITRSPLAVYLVYATIRDFFGKPTHVFTRSPGSRTAIRVFTLCLVITWSLLSFLTYFGGERVFKDGCPSITIKSWLIFKFANSFESLQWPVRFGLPTIPLFYLFYTARHWSDIREEYRRHKGNVVRWKHCRGMQTFFLAIKNALFSQWYVFFDMMSV